MRFIVMASYFAVMVTPTAAEQAATSPSVARAVFLNTAGDSIGTATLKETPNGVLIQAKLENVPPGIHGVHIHETGTCDASGSFESAGGHYAPGGKKHGFMVEGGPHAGDMINQTANNDRTMVIEIFNTRLSFDTGEAPLFDDDGSAIVIHATADDYTAQPAGAAGDRIACAVVEQ